MVMTTSFLMLMDNSKKPLIMFRVTMLQILTAYCALFRVCLANNATAIFLFGDSLVDAGNNNYMDTVAKANYDYNGIDFGGPTGRFCNGRTVPDIVGTELGLGLTPPYMDPTTRGSVILKGVNYGSGASGILNETGQTLGLLISVDAQIDNFANTSQEIISMIGGSAAQDLFRNSMFMVVTGSNDFLINYLISPVQSNFSSPETFVASMTSKFRLQITRLFNMGARKILVANVGPIGCTPFERDSNPDAGDNCAALPNQLAQLYNAQLKSLVEELSNNLQGSLFVYADVYHVLNDIVQNYGANGFENPDSACCRVSGRFGGLGVCVPNALLCEDRSKYVFWDAFHPSDAANTIIAKRLLDGDVNDISPMNIRQLVQA